MIIERAEVFHVAMPLIYPWRTAYGEDAAIHTVLVKLTAGDSEGWGEATPLERPEYSSEWAGGAFNTIRCWLGPELLGKELGSARDVAGILARFKGNYFAKAALETAVWAVEAIQTHQPIYTLLGGCREWVEVGADFGVMDSLDQLVEEIGDAVDNGYRRVKLKFRPGWDMHMLAAVRSTFPDLTIHIDCNSGFELEDVKLFKSLDRFQLAMIEQPLGHDDLIDHAKLQAQIDTPICLDESITSIKRAEHAVELGSCRYANLKPGRVGGLGPAKAIHDVFQAAGVPCWVGGNLESSIGAGMAVALATLGNFNYPADIFPSSRFYRAELAAPLVEFTRGSNGAPYALADALPRMPEPDRLADQTVSSASLSV